MSRLIVNSIKSEPDSISQALDNLSLANPLIANLDENRYTNIVQNFVNFPDAFPGTTSRVGTEITHLRTTITTRTNNSKILYNLFLCCEVHWDTVFFIQRIIGGVTTEIGSGNPAGSSLYGFSAAHHDADNDSTLSQVTNKFLDQPNVPAGTSITYVLRFYATSATYTLGLNRTLNAANSFNYERGSSVVILEELVV